MNEERYSRQIAVPQFGSAGQRRLSKSRVVMVGAGGLGCVVAPLLVGAGVGEITVVDHDQIALSNLHRQTLFSEAEVGLAKASCMADTLRALNSRVVVNDRVIRCGPGNVDELLTSAAVVIDAADNFPLSYLLSDACERHAIPLVAASVNRTYGYLGVFCGPAECQLPSFRAVFPKVPDTPLSCDVVGVTGPSVAAIGAVQAQETLKYLLGNPPRAQLWQFELWDYNVLCVDVAGALAPSEGRVEFISADQVHDHWVIDVREPDEVQDAPLPFAHVIHQPLSQLNVSAPIENDKPWVFACKSGQRALAAAQRLASRGNASFVLLPSD